MNLQLVENAHKAHRMISMQCMAGATALIGAWAALPDDLKTTLPTDTAKWVAYGALALLVLGMTGRVIHQPGVDDAKREST